MKHPEQSVYRLTFRVQPGSVPGPRRAAQLLRYALRVQGLVSTEAVQLHPEGARTAIPGTPAGLDEVFRPSAEEGPT